MSKFQIQKAKEKYPISNWSCGEITPPKQTYVRSKRFKFDVQKNISGYIFIGSDKVVSEPEEFVD